MAMIKLRMKDKGTSTSHFKLRGGYTFAILGILASLGLLISAKASEFWQVVITVGIGLLLYGLAALYQKIKKD